jgi:predicted methyltransferase
MRTIVILATLLVAAMGARADDSLQAILEARPAEDMARDQYRHPAETLAFFGLEPGMAVVETLPGGRAWYTKILAPYLGPEGTLYGANYTHALARRIFGEERWATLGERIMAFPETFPPQVAGYTETPPTVGTYLITEAPEALYGSFDVVLYIRSLHHLNRYDPTLLDLAAAETRELLKPGGVVGIVQHRAPESASDEWASGNNGYLKASRVIEAFEGAGLILEESSELNANPLDQPTEADRVWRLPPSNRGPEEDRDSNLAIGESDRMTLRFRKPG